MPELREVARISLARDGHVVDCVEDGVLALEKVLSEPTAYDLVMTDHHMPNMNGLDLVMQLRARAFPGKIMIFSSELNPDVASAYQRLNVDRILYKPVFPSTLRQVLVDLYASVPPARPAEPPS